MIWMNSIDICQPLPPTQPFKEKTSSILLMVWRQAPLVRHHPGPALTGPPVPCVCQTTTWHKTMTSPPHTICPTIARRQAATLLILPTCIVHPTPAAPVTVNIRITKNPILPWSWSLWAGAHNPPASNTTTACLHHPDMAWTVTMATPTCLKGTIPTPLPPPPLALSPISSWAWIVKCLTPSPPRYPRTNSGIDTPKNLDYTIRVISDMTVSLWSLGTPRPWSSRFYVKMCEC